ncbi:hypothetical protein GE061_014536 [Apolygus lucorum]|uniref:Uncharacterized protein n=1 Tax=Apolygus lucorum TaxID=248454 RepID=A0A8S9XL76_APOLU|nr:hypothetical protein GE061_014536 [Apolygus lucorum]
MLTGRRLVVWPPTLNVSRQSWRGESNVYIRRSPRCACKRRDITPDIHHNQIMPSNEVLDNISSLPRSSVPTTRPFLVEDMTVPPQRPGVEVAANNNVFPCQFV